jgi:FlaA1/EpsC-like NDP-sugar epimerase
MLPLENKRVLITGGTGSVGKMLVRRILSGEVGLPQRLVILSRDEAKQHEMQMSYRQLQASADQADQALYQHFRHTATLRIGDVRNYHNISAELQNIDVIFNAAALKQVPACEYFPYEAVRTNIEGAEHIIRAIRESNLPVETVIGISTDKACKPISVMGMTKAVQERMFIHANKEYPQTRFMCVRFGNVLASRGSVIPLFHDQIRKGGPVTITNTEMTRFLMSLDDAVDLVFAALHYGKAGDIVVPRMPAARMVDVAQALIGDRKNIEIKNIGIRPGEKIHEELISHEEAEFTVARSTDYYAIRPMLPELNTEAFTPALTTEYSSANALMTFEGTRAMLKKNRLLLEDQPNFNAEELLR